MYTTFAQIVKNKVAVNVSDDVVALHDQAQQAFTDSLHNGEDAYWTAEVAFTDALSAELKQQFPQLNETEMQKLFNKCYDTLLG